MIFSKGTGYALRALIFLAENREEGPFLAGVIAAEAEIPKPTLSKILNRLAVLKMVKSVSGPKGGFWLARDPEEITLKDLYDAFEPPRSLRECLLGHDECPGNRYCSLHLKWLKPQEHIYDFLKNTTIADITPLHFGLKPEEPQVDNE